ncbi:hypothetical protein Tco_0645222 [Tanacetum coccineum]
MNDFKRNKHFPEKIASNLKFLNNLQPEWSRHVTIVHQTKDLHTADYTQLYDFLKYNQKEADCSTGYEYRSRQTDADGWRFFRMQFRIRVFRMLEIKMGLLLFRGFEILKSKYGNGNVCQQQGERVIRLGILEEAGIQLQAEEFDLIAAAADLDKIEKVNANCTLIVNLQQASTSGTQTDKAPIYDSDGSAELSKEKATVSSLLEEKKRLKFDFKIREDEFLDKQIQLKNKIKELDNILVKTDFQSLAKEADESLAKHKALELEIERLLRAVVSQDIMSIVQNNSVVDTSNLQTELERTKERFENCIIKKENEYAKLWNDWYKKCEECKYDKISYDKAYNDMQQKIERLQAQLGDTKGKSKDTPCVSDTLDPLPQKLENENVELEFQVRNYEKENAHLKTAYKNLFDSINVTRAQTKMIIDSLQNKLHNTIFENCNTPKNGSHRNMFPGSLLHNTIAQVMRERPLTMSFEKKS